MYSLQTQKPGQPQNTMIYRSWFTYFMQMSYACALNAVMLHLLTQPTTNHFRLTEVPIETCYHILHHLGHSDYYISKTTVLCRFIITQKSVKQWKTDGDTTDNLVVPKSKQKRYSILILHIWSWQKVNPWNYLQVKYTTLRPITSYNFFVILMMVCVM